MTKGLLTIVLCLPLLAPIACSLAGTPQDLRVGVAGHAFDHVGTIGDQAEAALASGANIIYVSGVGAGYLGLPASEVLAARRKAAVAYLHAAKRQGIRLAIGYVCATSIVGLGTFDKNWQPEFRARFQSPPSDWRQQDCHGNPLASWYGGDYNPACMNNPDWRTYERFMVRQQLECGCDGIFFDNPTMHPQGCYCRFCMEKFAQFLRLEKPANGLPSGPDSLSTLRGLAQQQPAVFMRFRCTIARDFLADMRSYARSIKRGALMTANNSLNSSGALYSQCRGYAYNIYELSQAEDYVVVEDVSSQPRTLADGRTVEYGPTYKQLHAISHGKPVVAVTVAKGDYTTAPDLVRLAMAEAAANDASYLSWPAWPEKERQQMASAIRPEADFLRRNAALLDSALARREVVLFLPFRNWLTTGECRASGLAAELMRANVQFSVICEDHLQPPRAGALPESLRGVRLLLAPSRSDFTAAELNVLEAFTRRGGSVITEEKAEWLKDVQAAIGEPAVRLDGPASVRAVVRDQARRTVVHLLNLNVQRLSSFADKVMRVENLRLSVRVPRAKVRSVRAMTADSAGTSGALVFSTTAEGRQSLVQVTVPHLEIATILVIE
jgi:hypothetical protein